MMGSGCAAAALLAMPPEPASNKPMQQTETQNDNPDRVVELGL
jgi:hypothetical protein